MLGCNTKTMQKIKEIVQEGGLYKNNECKNEKNLQNKLFTG